MLSLVGALSLLGQVAKVDIRATGTPDAMQQSVLKAVLTATYAGAGLTVSAEHMTVHTDTYGATVVEVTGTSHTNEQIDGYWCMNDPALRNAFKDLAVMNTGLTDVTDVVTCVGASGAGCASSTPCGGGGGGTGSGGDEGTTEPEPESSGDGSNNSDDDDGGISTVGIVLIVIASLLLVVVLLYLLWPSLQTCWKAPQSPMVSSVPMTETMRTTRTGAEAFLAGDAL